MLWSWECRVCDGEVMEGLKVMEVMEVIELRLTTAGTSSLQAAF